MRKTGIISAPLWQSTSGPHPSSDSASAAPADDALSPSALSAKLAGSESSEGATSNLAPPSSRSPLTGQQTSGGVSSSGEESSSPSRSAMPSEAGNARGNPQPGAPLPGKAGFAGMLTVNDIIHLIQYYYQHSNYDNAAQDVEKFRLEMLREIEHTLHVPQPPLLSIEPLRSIFDACQLLIKTHARRLPLLDHDEQTGMETVVSVLTQYRVLKFIAMNCRETAGLNRTLRSLGIGTYVAGTRGVGGSNINTTAPPSARGSVSSSSRRSSGAAQTGMLLPPHMASSGPAPEATTPTAGTSTAEALPPLEELPSHVDSPALSPSPNFINNRLGTGVAAGPSNSSSGPSNIYYPIATATLDTTVFDVVHIFSERGISAVPILDEDGLVVDMYETVDVIDLVRSGAYQSLDLTIRQALSKRSRDFPGVMTCGPDDSLATIFVLLRTKRVHRLLILEPQAQAEDVYPLHDVEGSGPSGSPAKETQNDPLAGLGDIKNRKKGKLVGILCLSDVLRYIIGGKAGVPGGARTAGSATASAMGDREDPGGAGGSALAEADAKLSNVAKSYDEPTQEEAASLAPEAGATPAELPSTGEEDPPEQPTTTPPAPEPIQ